MGAMAIHNEEARIARIGWLSLRKKDLIEPLDRDVIAGLAIV